MKASVKKFLVSTNDNIIIKNVVIWIIGDIERFLVFRIGHALSKVAILIKKLYN